MTGGDEIIGEAFIKKHPSGAGDSSGFHAVQVWVASAPGERSEARCADEIM